MAYFAYVWQVFSGIANVGVGISAPMCADSRLLCHT